MTDNGKPPALQVVERDDVDLKFVWLQPGSAQENPEQWRTHPALQLDALQELIFGADGVGWAGVALINDRRQQDGWPADEAIPTHIDGHAREKLASNNGQPYPALIGHWSPEQERTLMALFDPLTEMAGADYQKQLDLMTLVPVGMPAVDEVLNRLTMEAEEALAALLAAGDGTGEDAATAHTTLAERFVVPPFSVLDARQGYWQDRKRAWLALGLQGELGRSEDTGNADSGAVYGKAQAGLNKLTGGHMPATSVFDPVLCEIMYRWFVPPGGHIINPTAGEAVYGVVAGYLGYSYEGVELRAEQVASNVEQWQRISGTPPALQQMKISAAWASKQLNCTLEGITRNCFGKCCTSPTFWPPASGGREDHACAHLGPKGCTLSPADKPVTCHLFPMKQNKHGTLVLWNRAAQPGSCCYPNYGHGPMVIEAIYESLVELFGQQQADHAVVEVKAGRDPVLRVPPEVAAAMAMEERWAAENKIPEPRSQQWIQEVPRYSQPTIDRQFGEVSWLIGDGRHTDQLVQPADFIMCCPPYHDLEVYSDDPADISTLSDYEEFLAAYGDIVRAAVAALKPNSFACFVVGDIRDSAGHYKNFVNETVSAFQAAGCHLYNEAAYITPAGSLPVRTAAQFPKGRKLGKSHQNVLVFVKGDWRAAVAQLGEVEVEIPDGFGQDEAGYSQG